MKRFSAWGFLLFTLWGVVMAITAQGWWLVALAGLQLVFGMAWSREGLLLLRRPRFWLFIGTALALSPFLARAPGATGKSLVFDRTGLSMGLEMAGRALALTLAFSLGLSALSLSDLMALFDRAGLRGLGFALGVAMNLLMTLREMATVTFETIRLRGGLRRPVMAVRLFLVTLVTNTLRYGDQIVDAAAVRAFDPNDGGRSLSYPASRWRRADGQLLAALLALGALFVAFS